MISGYASLNTIKRIISVQSDKLPAIAAMAERFAPLLGSYYYGIWQHNLIEQLTWGRVSRSKSSVATLGPIIYRAPSWSWASINGRVHFLTRLHRRYKVSCTLISIHTTPQDNEIPGGKILESSNPLREKLKRRPFDTPHRWWSKFQCMTARYGGQRRPSNSPTLVCK
jgi:hypothetical protein